MASYSLYPKNIRAYYIDLETLPTLFKTQVKHHKLDASVTGLWLTFSYSEIEAQKQTAELVKICTEEVVDYRTLVVVTSAPPKKKSTQIDWQMKAAKKYQEEQRTKKEQENEQAA